MWPFTAKSEGDTQSHKADTRKCGSRGKDDKGGHEVQAAGGKGVGMNKDGHEVQAAGGKGVGMNKDAMESLSSDKPLEMKEGETKIVQLGTDGCPYCARCAHDNKHNIERGLCVYYDVMKVDLEKMLANYPDLKATVINDLNTEPGIPKFYVVRCVAPGEVKVEDKILGYDKPKVDEKMKMAAEASAAAKMRQF